MPLELKKERKKAHTKCIFFYKDRNKARIEKSISCVLEGRWVYFYVIWTAISNFYSPFVFSMFFMKFTVSLSELPSYYNNEHKNMVLVRVQSSLCIQESKCPVNFQTEHHIGYSHAQSERSSFNSVWEKATIKVLAEDGNVSIIHLEFPKKHSGLNHVIKFESLWVHT